MVKLSVGLPVRNGERFLAETLDCLLSQTFQDFELIISDNGSTDRTIEICQSYDDPRIQIERQDTNQGAAWNFNRVFELSKGEFFKWAAHDDLISPDYLERCMSALHHEPESVLCYTGVQVIDEAGDLLEETSVTTNAFALQAHKRFREMVLKQHPCNHIFGVFRSEALRKSRMMGKYMASDRVLLAQLTTFGKFHEIPLPLFFWRRHPWQSIRFMKTPQAYTRWFDPQAEGQFYFPNWRILREYHKVIAESDMGWVDRLKCSLWLWVWPLRYAPWLGLDILRFLRNMVRKDLR